jgi:hypothetical protein
MRSEVINNFIITKEEIIKYLALSNIKIDDITEMSINENEELVITALKRYFFKND